MPVVLPDQHNTMTKGLMLVLGDAKGKINQKQAWALSPKAIRSLRDALDRFDKTGDTGFTPDLWPSDTLWGPGERPSL